jgi:hypothetical protein
MKANLTLDQFAAMIDALQAFLNEGKEPFDDPAFPLNWQPKPAGESGVEAISRGGKGGRNFHEPQREQEPSRLADVRGTLKREIIRYLKRYVAREVYEVLA